MKWWWGTALGRLLTACIAVFTLQVLGEYALHSQWLEYVFGLSLWGITHGRLWQLLTFQFLHGGLFHLVANVVGIYCLGRPLARVVGPRFMLAVWVVAGIVGGLAQVFWDMRRYEVVGASAAGFAYLVVFAVLFPGVKVMALFIPFPVKIWHFALGSVIATVGFLALNIMPGVGHVAHLGGALVGWLAGKWIRPRLPMIIPGAGGYGFGPSR